MSRTVRCVNRSPKNKINMMGRWWCWDFKQYDKAHGKRNPTKEELHIQLFKLTRESKSNAYRTPSRWFRTNRENEFRQGWRQAIAKATKEPDNECSGYNKFPLSHLWDWD